MSVKPAAPNDIRTGRPAADERTGAAILDEQGGRHDMGDNDILVAEGPGLDPGLKE